MSKTPEQMAEEYAEDWHKDCDYPEEILRHTKKATASVFLAGYQAAQQWVPVSERLPEDHSYYFVSSKKEASSTPYGWIPAGFFWDIEIAYFHQKNETWMTGIVALNCREEDKVPFAVSYWMPLPKLPEEA